MDGERTLVKGTLRWSTIALATVLMLGCVTTGSLIKSGDQAGARADWDAAVAYYREALTKNPKDIKAKLSLERAIREASLQHVARARALEAQELWAGAAAEYRLAAELLPSNALAVAKSAEIERKLRAQVEALRQPTRMEVARQQAAQQTGLTRLDPRVPVVLFRFNNSQIRDILNSFRDQTGINWTADEGLQGKLSTGYTIDVQDTPLEEALNKVMSANKLVYKVTDSKTIFVYEDTPQKRQQWDDRYQRVFYLSNAEANDVMQMINGLMGQGGATGPAVRPVIQQNKSANALVVWATLPVLDLIGRIVDTVDKPKAEVLVDVQILEVSRRRLRELGLDLSAYSLGFALVPDVPAGGTPTLPPPPVSIGRLRQGVGANDVFTSLPTAVVRFLENDQHTRLLARPQLRGREGSQLTLQLGDDIPYAQTAFLPIAGGGVPTQPQVSYTFRPVGVNLTMTPKVTHNDEVILDPIQVEKSALAAQVDVGGGVFAPSFSKRIATVSMRLRDGESNLLAGLIAEQDTKTYQGIPGINSIPILRSIFGTEKSNLEQSELVMIVTPYIIRSREITAADLRPLFVGAGSNVGGQAPSLISPDAPPPPATAAGQPGTPLMGPPATPVNTAGPGAVPPPTPPAGAGNPATAPPPAGAGANTAAPPLPSSTQTAGGRPPGIVNIQAVGSTPASGPPPPQATPAQLLINAPAGELQMGGAPYSVPLSITNVSQLATVTVTVTYDPAILKAEAVVQGSFMQQGGVTPTFSPKIDAAAGRVDIVVTRGVDQPGASGTGPIAAIVFKGVASGSSKITVVGVAMTPGGQAIPVQAGPPASVVVK
jgi:general secretion pathway protein D